MTPTYGPDRSDDRTAQWRIDLRTDPGHRETWHIAASTGGVVPVIDPSVDGVAFLALLGVHVAAGVLALLAGLGAIVTTKGGSRHGRAGRLYVASMGIVVTTAAPLAVWVSNWFLLAIAVFSGYLVFGGYRVVWRRRAGLTDPARLDYVGHGTMAVVGAAMILAGVWGAVRGTMALGPVLVAFGAIGSGLAVQSLVRLRRPAGTRQHWIPIHLQFMGGAYIATVTAAVTVNLTMVPSLARWLGPTAIGVPLLAYAAQRYESRFGTRRDAPT